MSRIKCLGIIMLVFGFTMLISSYGHIEEKGLVGYWKFDEGKGNIARDSSGMGNDGTVHSTAWVKGKSGSALQFDGVDDYVDCGNDESLNLTSAITIEVWVKIISASANYGIITKMDGPHTKSWNMFYDTGGHIRCFIGNGTAIGAIMHSNKGGYADSTWHHLVLSYDGTGYLYIDGIKQNDVGTSVMVDSGLPVQIGRKYSGSGSPINGTIDEVKIYNYARTGNEIKKDYNVGEINVFKGRIDKLMSSLKKTLDLTKEERKSLRIRIEGIERKLSEISHYLNSTLSIPEQILEKKAEEISRLKMRISQIEYYLSLSKEERKNIDYTVGIATSLDKVFKDRVWDKSLIKELRFQMAINEYESAQIVIAPLPLIDELKEVKVTCSDLISEEGKKIASDNIDIRPVGYVCLSSGQSWPDPLLHNKNFDIASNQVVQPVWITVYTPVGTMPGEYNGTLSICPSNSPAKHLPVSVEVWDFELSQELLPTDFSFRPAQVVMFYYGSGHKTWERMPAPLCRKYFKFLLRYRITPQLFNESAGGGSGAYVSYLGERWDGDKLILDFDEFDKNVELMRRNGVRFIRAGYMGNGKPGKYWRSYLPRMCEHIKQKGWPETFYFYLRDEPRSTEGFEIVKEQSALVAKLAPGLKRLNTYSKNGFEDYFSSGPEKYIDIWVPYLPLGLRESFWKERRENGEAVWLYITDHYATPNFLIQHPAIEHRVLFWLLEKYKADGFLYWGLSVWQPMTVNDIEEDGSPKKSWNPLRLGDGNLTYPAGKNIEDGLNPSIRLEVIRDGLEDWEYFRLLKEKLKELKKKGGNKYHGLIKKTGELLEIEDSIVKDEHTFTKDPQKIYKRRKNIARHIEKINQILKER